ncbi:MAG TPA: hypothetical protein VK975_05935 [Acidimicrobiales bacterium]|nr:hypothetical protein [Acidimicrobiales bacterium]
MTAFGAVYLALAIGGALSAHGLEVLHLDTADHVFHAGVGLPAWSWPLERATASLGARARGRSHDQAPLDFVGLVLCGRNPPGGAADRDQRLFSLSRDHSPSVVDAVGVSVLLAGWLVLDHAAWGVADAWSRASAEDPSSSARSSPGWEPLSSSPRCSATSDTGGWWAQLWPRRYSWSPRSP